MDKSIRAFFSNPYFWFISFILVTSGLGLFLGLSGLE